MASVFANRRTGKPGQTGSIRDLQVRAAELENFRLRSGARQIPQAKPGAFRTIVDLLSRVEFAEAGFLEEFVQGVEVDGIDTGDFVAGIGRAGKELFSGVAGIKGEKRGFSEAMEKIGIGDMGRLSDIVPALEGSFFDASGRGVLGFVMGVAGDPLTYTGLGAINKVGGNLGRLGGRVVAGAGDNAARAIATKAGRKFAQREAQRILPRANGRLLVDQADDITKEGADLFRMKALDDIMQRVDGSFTSNRQRVRSVEALRKGKLGTLNKADRALLTKELGGDFRDEFIDVTMKNLVDDEVRTMIRSGIGFEDEIASDLLMIAQNQAEKRMIEAAKHTPGLLKKGRGITFLGRDIPGTDKLTAIMGSGLSRRASEVVHRLEQSDSGLATTVADAARGVKQTLDAFGGLFYRDFKTRNLPGFNILKQAAIDAHGAITAKLLADMQQGALAKLGRDPDVWKRVTSAVDEGAIDALQGVEKEAAEQMVRLNNEMVAREVQAGLLKSDQAVENYVAHFYENTTDELTQTVAAWKPPAAQLASLGRHGEERAFKTLREAVDTSTKYSKSHKNVVPLRPIYDPVEIMRRRAIAHADGMSHAAYFEAVGREFGVETVSNISRDAALKWIQPGLRVLPKEQSLVTNMVVKGRTPLQAVRGLTRDGRREFMRQRLLKVTTKRELDNTLAKYSEFFDDLPQGGSILGQIAEDGSRYVSLTQKGLTQFEIPKTIADDIQGMAQRVLHSKDMNRLLRGYSKVNNFFKRMVTIYFPSFHFRNAYSNVAQSFLDIGIHALDPRLHKHSVGVMAGLKGELVDDLGKVLYDYDNVRELSRRFGVMATARQITEQSGEATAKEVLRSVKGVGGKVRKVGAAIENEARMSLFIAHLRRGLSPQDAAVQVKKFLFDYSNLSTFEEGARLAIPFYVWTRKNLELQIRTLLTQPGREPVR